MATTSTASTCGRTSCTHRLSACSKPCTLGSIGTVCSRRGRARLVRELLPNPRQPCARTGRYYSLGSSSRRYLFGMRTRSGKKPEPSVQEAPPLPAEEPPVAASEGAQEAADTDYRPPRRRRAV